QQREQTLTAEVVRDFRLAGDAHLQNDRPDQALRAYQRGVQDVVKKQTPQLWAAIWREIWGAQNGLALHEKGPAFQQSLREAAQAYQQALEVHTHAHLPQAWAETQLLRGFVLVELSVTLPSEEGIRVLQEAIAIPRHALEVISRLEQ